MDLSSFDIFINCCVSVDVLCEINTTWLSKQTNSNDFKFWKIIIDKEVLKTYWKIHTLDNISHSDQHKECIHYDLRTPMWTSDVLLYQISKV